MRIIISICIFLTVQIACDKSNNHNLNKSNNNSEIYLDKKEKENSLKKEREYYESEILRLTKNKLNIIRIDDLLEKNKAPFIPDYRNKNLEKYSYHPYIKYPVLNNEMHTAISCITQDRKKSVLIILTEYSGIYVLKYFEEYKNREFFVNIYKEKEKTYLHVQFENDTDYAVQYYWDGVKYNKIKI